MTQCHAAEVSLWTVQKGDMHIKPYSCYGLLFVGHVAHANTFPVADSALSVPPAGTSCDVKQTSVTTATAHLWCEHPEWLLCCSIVVLGAGGTLRLVLLP